MGMCYKTPVICVMVVVNPQKRYPVRVSQHADVTLFLCPRSKRCWVDENSFCHQLVLTTVGCRYDNFSKALWTIVAACLFPDCPLLQFQQQMRSPFGQTESRQGSNDLRAVAVDGKPFERSPGK